MSKRYFFTDDNGLIYPEWDKKKLGELEDNGTIKLSRGQVISKPDMRSNPGEFPVYSASVLKNGLMGKYGLFMFDEELISWSVDGGGHFFYRPKHKFSVTNVSGTMQVKDETIVNCKFLFHALDNLHGGLKFDYLTKAHPSVIRTMYNVPLPSLAEQQKIAEFFSALDERIALTADKVKLLKEQKQGYLQKIFAREIAFTDDNGDQYPEWEQKKLGAMGETFTGLTGKTKEDFGVGDHEFITYMNVFSNIIANPRMVEKVTLSPDENQNEVKQGDILFTTSSETLKDVGMASLWDTEKSAFLNSFCFGFKISDPNVLPRYLVTALHSPIGRKRIIFLGQGSTRINISKTKLMEILIPLPSLPEQKKIAEFFSALDEQIELTENKLTLLKEQKKGYLQGIFG